MANTADTSKAGNIIEVTYSGTGDDWDYVTDGEYASAIKVQSIQWHPSADGDKLVINEGGLNGPSIVHSEATDSGGLYQFDFGEGTWMKPYIDLTDCTYDTVTSIKIIFVLAQGGM